MAEDHSSDFTFCQFTWLEYIFNRTSTRTVPENWVESPKSLSSIQNIKLDEPSNDTLKQLEGSNLNNTQSRQMDNSTPMVNFKREELAKPSSSSRSTGESGNAVTEKKPVQKKTVRAKVPFEKGYSQMDWLKLTRTDLDLAGLKGKSNRRLITLEEVKQHKTTEGHIWTVLKGSVYNISPYLKFHPGGVDMLMKAAGKDCTSLFNKYHAWVNAEFMLEQCLVGFLDVNE